jgi:hypothetical protein
MTPSEDAASPTDQEPVIHPDVGGWISGPRLDAEELALPGDWRADLSRAFLAERGQGPAQ